MTRAAAVPAAVALAAASLWPHRDHVALWDARIYADCALASAGGAQPWGALQCAGHPSLAALGWDVLFLRLLPESGLAFLLAGLVLVAIGADGAHRLLRALLPGEAWAPLAWLGALLVAVHPLVLAGVLHPNLDLAVAMYLLAALGALAEGRVATAALWGVGLAFSKETGAALTVVLLVAGLALRRQHGAAWRTACRSSWPLAVPPLAFAAWVGVRTALAPDSVGTADALGSAVQLSTWQPQAPLPWTGTAPLRLALIGILGFGWTLVPPYLALGRRLLRRSGAPDAGDARAHPAMAAWLLALLGTMAVTIVPSTLLFPRYGTAAAVLLAVGAPVALALAGTSPRACRGATVAWLGLLLLATHRSADPVSRWWFGTFDAGARPMYAIGSAMGERLDAGRDHLVYNLEFTGFADAPARAMHAAGVASGDVVSLDWRAQWHTLAPMDSRTGARSYRVTGVVAPRYLTDRWVPSLAPRPDALWYVRFPSICDGEARRRLGALYGVRARSVATAGAVTVTLLRLERWEDATATAAGLTALPAESAAGGCTDPGRA